MSSEVWYIVQDKKIIKEGSFESVHKKHIELCDKYEADKDGGHCIYKKEDGKVYYKGVWWFQGHSDEITSRMPYPLPVMEDKEWNEILMD